MRMVMFFITAAFIFAVGTSPAQAEPNWMSFNESHFPSRVKSIDEPGGYVPQCYIYIGKGDQRFDIKCPQHLRFE